MLKLVIRWLACQEKSDWISPVPHVISSANYQQYLLAKQQWYRQRTYPLPVIHSKVCNAPKAVLNRLKSTAQLLYAQVIVCLIMIRWRHNCHFTARLPSRLICTYKWLVVLRNADIFAAGNLYLNKTLRGKFIGMWGSWWLSSNAAHNLRWRQGDGTLRAGKQSKAKGEQCIWKQTSPQTISCVM